MRKQRETTPAAVGVDGRLVSYAVDDSDPAAPKRVWSGGRQLRLVAAILCRRGKVHLLPLAAGVRSLCGEDMAGPGWRPAPGSWLGTGVVRCQHCEKSLARMMGEPAARRT
jgi:hypothetical protein